MPFSSLAKMLMGLGVVIFLVGLIMLLGARFGLGQLPGDLSGRRGNFSWNFPIVTSIVVSIVLTILLNFFARFFR